MNATTAIRIYDAAIQQNSDLAATAKYLAKADQKERDRFTRCNPRIAAALNALINS
jgi:hypothetical protein